MGNLLRLLRLFSQGNLYYRNQGFPCENIVPYGLTVTKNGK